MTEHTVSSNALAPLIPPPVQGFYPAVTTC